MEESSIMKWIEWGPVPFNGTAREDIPPSFAKGLHTLSISLLLPMGILGYMSTDWPLAWQLLPLYLSLFIFGMPHGGADHLLLWGMVKKSPLAFRIVTLLAYPLLSIAYLVFWNFQPVPSAIFFLALTIFHWGQGDRYLSIKLHRAQYLVRSKSLSWLHIFARGSLPILLPGFLGNETYRLFLESMVRQGGGSEQNLEWITQNQILFLMVPLLLIGFQIIGSLLKHTQEERVAFCTELLEPAFLFIWFLWVPPLWALGTYFALWHSLRHGLRILWMDQAGRKDLLGGHFLRIKGRWLQLTSLMTVLALLGLWLILSMPLYFRGIQLDWLGKAMLGISILTLPHTVVVCLMDRFQLRNARAKGN